MQNIDVRRTDKGSIGTIFASNLAPRYFRSMYIAMGLTAFGLLMAIVLVSLPLREIKMTLC
jgi:hypothetical protein